MPSNRDVIISDREDVGIDDGQEGGTISSPPSYTSMGNVTTYTGRTVTLDFRITGLPVPSVLW